MTKRIDWTPDEEAKVVASIKELAQARRVKLPMEAPFGKPSLLLALTRDAQIVLAAERRRPFKAAEQFRGLWPKLVESGVLPESMAKPWEAAGKGPELTKDQIRINHLADERDAALAQVEAAHKEIERLTAENMRLQSRLDKVPSELDVVKTFLGDILARGVAAARAEPAKPLPAGAATGDELNRLQAEAMRKRRVEDLEPQPSTYRGPKVVVLGLLGQQRTEIHNEFKDSLDLRYFTADEARGRLGNLSPNTTVVVWTKFVSHDSYNNLPHGVKPVFVNNLLEMRAALQRIAKV